MYGGFSFEQDAMRARDELQDALSVFQPPQMPPMAMQQPQQPQMGMQQQQMPGQMGQMQPQQQQMGMQQQQMGQMQPQMGMQQPMQQPMQPPMGPQAAQQGAFAVNPQQYAKGGAVKGAWTRKEGKNPEGGLNAKGRASLKAQGQDIKPPVSAKQAASSPKAAARRKSFCARMGGMEGPMKDESGKPTRKALALRKWDCKAEGGLAVKGYAEGGKSRVNEAGNYTKPGMRKSLFESIKAGGKGGAPGQWSARKAQMLAQQYKAKGGGYRD